MHFKLAVAFALVAASSSLSAQGIADLSTATPVPCAWSYNVTTDGSEARFSDASAKAQLILHCTRATRRVSISKPAPVAASTINVWTSSQTRDLPSTFNSTTGLLSADLQAY